MKKDREKTRDELIEELETARRRISSLESEIEKLKMKECGSKERLPRQPRRQLRSNVEFTPDFDIVEAIGINISQGGLCFEVREDLPFEMRFEMDNKLHRYRANLIWMKRLPEGGYRFGFMFVSKF